MAPIKHFEDLRQKYCQRPMDHRLIWAIGRECDCMTLSSPFKRLRDAFAASRVTTNDAANALRALGQAASKLKKI